MFVVTLPEQITCERFQKIFELFIRIIVYSLLKQFGFNFVVTKIKKAMVLELTFIK